MLDSAPTPPEELSAPVQTAEIEVRVQPGQRQELNVQAGPGGVAVKRQGGGGEVGEAWGRLLLGGAVLVGGFGRVLLYIWRRRRRGEW
ncbi:MAG: hypothetical protein EG825_17435 [Rhodocyclaceae bacterium]|nr:hypothetical protein [Rhodocyclaceae bacterium]